MTSFEDRLTHDAETWKPHENPAQPQVLIGVLIDYEERESDYSTEQYPVLEIATDDGQVWTWFASQTGARAQVTRAKPQVGEPPIQCMPVARAKTTTFRFNGR